MHKIMTVQLEHGLDARAIALFVQTASEYESSIHVELAGKKVNAKSIMGMMSLSLQHGDEIGIAAEGKDEEKAVIGLEQFLNGVDA